MSNIKKVVFVSNYYTHHQSPFCENMRERIGNNFFFIETEEMDEQRTNMGWTIQKPPFVLNYNNNKSLCDDIIKTSDVMIFGNCPQRIIDYRLKTKKMTFACSERIYKKGFKLWKTFKWIFTVNRKYPNRKNFYLLCPSAFSSFDFSRTFTFKKKCYKWGYFPKTFRYDIRELIEKKENDNFVSILYVSRLIPLKRPEYPIFLAKKLKEDGISFHLTIIGSGQMENEISSLIKSLSLESYITHISSIPSNEIRNYMEKANIFIFTSDKHEGWGAVINESMNSGCAVVTSSAVGSTPYLIKNNVNGYVFKDGDFEDFYTKVKELCFDKKKRERFGMEAYDTIVKTWNAEKAVDNFLALVNDLTFNKQSNVINEGPCSIAQIIKDNWFDGYKI